MELLQLSCHINYDTLFLFANYLCIEWLHLHRLLKICIMGFIFFKKNSSNSSFYIHLTPPKSFWVFLVGIVFVTGMRKVEGRSRINYRIGFLDVFS